MDELDTNSPAFSETADRRSDERFQKSRRLSVAALKELDTLRRAHAMFRIIDIEVVVIEG